MSILLVTSCAHKNSKAETNKYAAQFKEDNFTYSGEYVWAFNLMGEQVSTHKFYPDSIAYTMDGKVYSTDYTMKKLSYEKEKDKWIGEDGNGIIYVLFFKEKTDSTLTIYKHKCKTNGLEEALNFDIPAADATDDHGWNVYALNGNDTRDVLPIMGRFANLNNEIFISDSLVRFNQKNTKKISFHSGERRWVGKFNDSYLQVFFTSFEVKDSIRLSATWFTDVQAMYNTKYSSLRNWEVYTNQ
ncbi:MAG: hypothetical protein AAGA43_15240 [Bacteroidota bacterium]